MTIKVLDTHRIPNEKTRKEIPHETIKTLNVQDKRKDFKNCKWKTKQITSKGRPIRITLNFSLKARKTWRDVLQILRWESRLLYPAKLSVTLNGKRKAFPFIFYFIYIYIAIYIFIYIYILYIFIYIIIYYCLWNEQGNLATWCPVSRPANTTNVDVSVCIYRRLLNILKHLVLENLTKAPSKALPAEIRSWPGYVGTYLEMLPSNRKQVKTTNYFHTASC